MKSRLDSAFGRSGKLALLFALTSCSSDYSMIADYQPNLISCTDGTTTEIQRKFEHDFIRVEEGEPGVDERHSSAQMRQWVHELLQSSKKLADSGNPYGMGFFGDMMEHELVLFYLDEKHIFTPKEAAAVSLPEHMHGSMVATLSYLYIAEAAKGDPGDRARKVIEKIRFPSAVDGSSAPDYVRISASWFEEALVNAERWKKNCLANPKAF